MYSFQRSMLASLVGLLGLVVAAFPSHTQAAPGDTKVVLGTATKGGGFQLFGQALATHAPGVDVDFLDGQAQLALTAADAVLVASGTATLETLLCKRPMVVAYRLGALTAWMLKSLGLMKAPHFAQPNLLAGRRVVPELFQSEVTPERLGSEIARWLDSPAERAALEQLFADIHRQLRHGGSDRAADAVLRLVKQEKGTVPFSGPEP